MATAQEILDTMEEVEEQSVLEIDSDLRTIKIPGDIKILGVESDEDVFRLHFRMPKMYGEVDLSEFKLRINYTNAKQEGDVYEVNGENIKFSWLVGSHATKYKGNVDFIVCAKMLDSNGVKKREFNTTPSTLPVLRGLETGEEVVQKNPDILEDILLRLGDLEKGGGAGGASIDDTKPSAETTYSSSKIDELLNAQKEANEQQDKTLNNLSTNKLDASALPTAINTALAQAKESGQFNGNDGEPGEDGKTPEKGVDYWTAEDKEGIVSDVLAALPNASGVSF